VYSKDWVIVAVRQGNILATTFHPKLSSDSRRRRILLRVHWLDFSHGRGLQKLADGMQSRPLVDLPLADGESGAVSKQVTQIPIVPV